jgi:hypothetical protein
MAKWIHVGRYAVGPGDERRVIGQFENPMPQQQAECKDTVDTCQSWSMQGERRCRVSFANPDAAAAARQLHGAASAAIPPFFAVVAEETAETL